MSDATREDVWTVVLHEIIMHVQKFLDDNPMEYGGKEKKAYSVALGMVTLLCKQMIEDIMEDKDGLQV